LQVWVAEWNGDVAEEGVGPRKVGVVEVCVDEVTGRDRRRMCGGRQVMVDMLALRCCPRPETVGGVGVREAAADAPLDDTKGAFGDSVGVGDVWNGEGARAR
jgi:hypothetical protein